MRDLDEVNRLLDETERNLAKLSARRDKLLGQLAELRREKASLFNLQEALPQPKLPSVTDQSSPEAKIALFRSLFRGREDVYARRFESIVATGRYLGEGFDNDQLDTLFLALPISWRGTLTQYTGRLHRLSAAKREVIIYDYVDLEVPVLAKMYARRRAGYKAIGYEIALPGSKVQANQLTFRNL